MKFVVALMSFATLALAVMFFCKREFSPEPASVLAKAAISPPPTARPGPAVDGGSPRRFEPDPSATPAETVRPPMTPEEKQAYLETETSRLQDLSTQSDPASLSAILMELNNPEKEVRLAAIEATKQFGSKDAIPALQAGVAGATDSDEKIALLEAADFLSLPTLADVTAQPPPSPDQIQAIQEQRQRQAARKQYLMQKHAQDRNTTIAPVPNPQPPQ